MHRTIRVLLHLLVCALVALTTVALGTASAAEPPPGIDPQVIRDHDKAIELALKDPRVKDRLALRPGMEVVAGHTDFTKSSVPADRVYGINWLVEWHEPGKEDDPALSVVVDVERGVLHVGGLGLIVMPGPTRIVENWFESSKWWGALAAGFLICVAGVFRRGDGARMLAPLVVLAAAYLVTIENVIPRSFVRGGNLLLFGVALVALAAGAWIWARRPRRAAPDLEPRWPAWGWAVTWIAGLGIQLRSVLQVEEPIDVAFASDIGARLMQGGVPVYGNLEDAPQFVVHGDTYGPISYLAYVPGVSITEDRIDAVVFSNFALSVLVGLLLLYVGVRAGSWVRGLWAAAAWSTCPIAAIGVIAGNNDVVVATTVMLLLLVLTRPVWRGALVAVAASTKFLPVLLVVPLLRLRGEARRDITRYLGGFVGALVVIYAIALRGLEAFDEFWNRTVAFQVGRSDIKSFWGLAEIPDARHVFNAAAILLAIWCAVRWRQLSPSVAAGSVAAILALVIAALPQYWGSYSVWFVPAVLVAMLWRGQEPSDASTGSTGNGSTADDATRATDPTTEPRALTNA